MLEQGHEGTRPPAKQAHARRGTRAPAGRGTHQLRPGQGQGREGPWFWAYRQATNGFGAPGASAAAAGLPGFPPATSGMPTSPAALLHRPLLRNALEQQTNEWPAFLKPVPDRILAEDRQYLLAKQVFTLPPLRLQNALLAAYVDYVHPYMPLLELHDFLRVVGDRSGASGKVSLFLYHSVMFAGTAFVDETLLKDAGYESRRDARRSFFSRTRLLYDFDYETDRLVLVQGLLLMTYWYETPDDQKDTWHWMGVAISLAHTIGLHRDPSKTPMIPRKQKLWKRVWWSCLMRDRLVALGMRRPTRIKSEDFDVPQLNEDDFEIDVLPEENQLPGFDSPLIRDVEMQRELAVMCIEKAKLCMFIGDMLKVQYSVLSRSGMQPEHTTNSTHMLLPNKNSDNMEEVESVDLELRDWFAALPESCHHQPLGPGSVTQANKAVAVQRNLLHMIYHTTISALHRPLFLPASPTEGPTTPLEVQETARQRVREAAEHITGMATEMRNHNLERYLPTTGVTVILPAMIVHMLDTKSLVPETRANAIQGLKECLIVMSNLRNIYAAADFATGFLDALLRKGMLGSQPPPTPTPVQQAPPAGMRSGKMLNRVLAPALNLAPQGQGQAGGLAHERPSTPPPDAGTFLNPAATVNLFPHGSGAHHHGFLADGDGDLAISGGGATTPPHTDSEDVSTPPPSQQQHHHVGLQDMDVDMAMADDMLGGVAFEYATAAVAAADGMGVGGGAANNFDFDQWLQFPTEGGLGTGDDTFMGGMFGSSADHGLHHQGLELSADLAGGLDWMGNLPEGISH
ncbi:fungal-specific transcription factor domain-containing protein [Staphylotrichum tortipilum]|uniref:Fungal-specific transcription factor domain-containing protein n=1 Tax=Staphylotrichum tortipilum TaxID=2831512 RepID=A0AAN6MBI8_9PEZI|nr:fungal-specific transcription factor domain-containing protein [Staphylotrichum longicolle]